MFNYVIVIASAILSIIAGFWLLRDTYVDNAKRENSDITDLRFYIKGIGMILIGFVLLVYFFVY